MTAAASSRSRLASSALGGVSPISIRCFSSGRSGSFHFMIWLTDLQLDQIYVLPWNKVERTGRRERVVHHLHVVVKVKGRL